MFEEKKKFLLSKEHSKIWHLVNISAFIAGAEIIAGVLPFVFRSVYLVYLFTFLCILSELTGIAGLLMTTKYSFLRKQQDYFMFISLWAIGYFAFVIIMH